MQRGQAISKREWKLLRVAVVGVTDHAYVGRLFFGDSETGKVVWDCDCRPSDACWLALSTDAPMLVKKAVWMDHAVQMKETAAYKVSAIAMRQL
jgi:bifunctional DNase/RNase